MSSIEEAPFSLEEYINYIQEIRTNMIGVVTLHKYYTDVMKYYSHQDLRHPLHYRRQNIEEYKRVFSDSNFLEALLNYNETKSVSKNLSEHFHSSRVLDLKVLHNHYRDTCRDFNTNIMINIKKQMNFVESKSKDYAFIDCSYYLLEIFVQDGNITATTYQIETPSDIFYRDKDSSFKINIRQLYTNTDILTLCHRIINLDIAKNTFIEAYLREFYAEEFI